MHPRNQRRLQAQVAIGDWIQALPSVKAIRPARCPRCGIGSRPPEAPLRIIGHGLRLLVVWGQLTLNSAPTFIDVQARRFRCLECSAIFAVVPTGVAPGRRYFMPSIALALALWSLW